MPPQTEEDPDKVFRGCLVWLVVIMLVVMLTMYGVVRFIKFAWGD